MGQNSGLYKFLRVTSGTGAVQSYKKQGVGGAKRQQKRGDIGCVELRKSAWLLAGTNA